MSRIGIFKEFFLFIKQEKKWWLFPVILFMLLAGFLVIFVESSALAPLLYPLF